MKPNKRAKKTLVNTAEIVLLGPQCYQWSSNSCWLDTSLQMLFVSLLAHLDELAPIFSHLPVDSGLQKVYNHLKARKLFESEDRSAISAMLTTQREEIRNILVKNRNVGSMNSFGPLYVCIEKCFFIIYLRR